MRKLIIFGAGSGGLRAFEWLKDNFSIIAFSDNDPKKHGTYIFGVPVIRPDDIPAQEYDLVVIASRFAKEIRAQLNDIGIGPGRIHEFDVDESVLSIADDIGQAESELEALRGDSCERIIIFGAGSRAKLAWEQLSSRFEILCFADNDAKKHGTVFLGRRIIKPAEIPQYQFDKIVVASVYTREILPQLKEIGIDKAQIQCF